MKAKVISVYIFLCLLSSVIAQNSKRVFREANFDLQAKVNLSDFDFFRPNLLDLNGSGDLVFFDFSTFQLVHTKIDSLHFKKIGEGRGRGPSEFMMIMDLKVDEKGRITLADSHKGKLLRWTINGQFIDEYQTGGKLIRPSRVTLCDHNDRFYVLSSQYSRNGIFHQYDGSGKRLLSFQKIEGFENRLPFSTDGELACDKNNNLFFASRYRNSIKKYNDKGKLIYDIPAKNFSGNEVLIQRDGNFFDLHEDVKRVNGDIQIVGSQIWVGFSGRKDNKIKFIDVYDVGEGKYHYSIKLPNLIQEFDLSEENIAFLRELDNGEVLLEVYTLSRIP